MANPGVWLFGEATDMRLSLAGTTLLVFFGQGAYGQAFEVASIRQNRTGARGGSVDFSKTKFPNERRI
jgi:hypothetical protein